MDTKILYIFTILLIGGCGIFQAQSKPSDSIILPPLHYTNTFYQLKDDIEDFRSISIEIEIKNQIPKNYYFYIAPLNLEFNGIPIYSGLQSKGDGIDSKTSQQENYIPFNGIFSRWNERNKNALKTNGYYISSDTEGDFISVRNPVAWNKGNYRITIKKDGYIPGQSVSNIDPDKTYFGWGKHEHTWLTMTVEDLKSHKITTIGSLAFPGKKISLNKNIVSFLEQYRYLIDFAKKPRFGGDSDYIYYKDIPYIKIIQKNILINGKPVYFEKVKTLHNNTVHSEQEDVKKTFPILSRDNFNTRSNELILETGILNSNKK
ncbi:hypothetical protein [Chryseobacterium gwangjuense]|uniref:hypothetical protein n=1 Tax=Chryseobacterium gwangjuense TaxID=1069980 RepID=UPI001E5A9DB6|nr:hypothetical protein [Chryseobacterium gwangjuense]MCE3075383.1 hypothetical protein [Chryseobacterium gwangjuense]